MKILLMLLAVITSVVVAQDKNESTNSLFDDSRAKEYSLSTIFVGGEVAEPGDVDLSALPLHSFPMKEVEVKNNGKYKFDGSYFCTGYSLLDIVSLKKEMKANAEEFRPFVDLYVIVENDKGDKAVFSWGEIFYSRDNFKIILTKRINGINPSKMTMEWPLPEEPRIVCANDLTNTRFISNPTRIIVKSSTGEYAKERRDDIFSADIKIITGNETITVAEIDKIDTRKLTHVGYGHGRGYKGVNDFEGYVFKDVLNSVVNLPEEYLSRGYAIVSAKDGYRTVFSIAEIFNRSDMNDFLLIDHGDSPSNGRYTLMAIPDFFVDRNVRSVEKFEIRLAE